MCIGTFLGGCITGLGFSIILFDISSQENSLCRKRFYFSINSFLISVFRPVILSFSLIYVHRDDTQFFIQKYRGCLRGVFTMSNLVTVLFLSIILRSVLVGYPYLWFEG